jgi:hypothetical protein
MDRGGALSDSCYVAPQPIWWHDLQIVAIARAVLLNLVGFLGLLMSEGLAAHLIDGHTPVWGTVGKACFAVGMFVTEVGSVAILLHAPSRREL